MLTLASLANQTVSLTDAAGREIGTIAVEDVRDDLILGTFVPGPDFAADRPTFFEFEEAAEAQALSVVDQIEKQIDALGLRIHPRGISPVRVYDVQIWSDGGVSCRLRPFRPVAKVSHITNGISAGADAPTHNSSAQGKA